MFSKTIQPRLWYRDKKVTVVGLGSFGGGAGVTCFLDSLGARVTVTDLKTGKELENELAGLADRDIKWVLGEHRDEDLLEADLVVLNPAIPRSTPLVERCLAAGVPLETEMNLFFKYCRGKICAITGSNGKTTTTSLAGAMARQRWPGLLIGGNIGQSLLPQVDEIAAEDWVILELSSFQLDDLASIDRRPNISVITNLSENHIDWHGSYDNYLAAKRQILRTGPAPDIAVLNLFDPLLRKWAGESSRELRAVSAPGEGTAGVIADMDTGDVRSIRGGREERLFSREDLQLRGDFNLINAATAAAAAVEMGVGPPEILEATRSFKGVEHRLQLIGTFREVEYFNDSIATTQESTVAALQNLGPVVILICGGKSKGCGFDQLAATAAKEARHVILIGETAGEIEAAIRAAGAGAPELTHAADLRAAVETATRSARPGDRVLLSPACPSYDQFKNFEERGKEFCRLVEERFGE
jgi:UDP-N-acetylmuramoylalanine--D-glutamate ligase